MLISILFPLLANPHAVQAKRPAAPARVFPVAKLLGKPYAQTKSTFNAAVKWIPAKEGQEASKSWSTPRRGPNLPRPEPDSLADVSSRQGDGGFYAKDSRASPTFCAFGEFVDGRVASVSVDAPRAWTWQRHLQLAGLSASGVRAKSLGPKLVALEGVKGLPAGTRITRTTEAGFGGSEMVFRLPRKGPMLVQLDQLCNPSQVLQGWSGMMMGVGWSIAGKPLVIGGRTFTHGMGTHAVSRIAFDLNGNASVFRSSVGIDDETKGKGLVVFRVLGDGVSLWESGPVKGGDAAKRVNVPLKGVKRLELIVEDGGDGGGDDHADWGHAVLDWTSATSSPRFVPTR